MNNKKILIGELSGQTGVPTKTIRYYEEFGLLSKPERSKSSYRVYSKKDIEKLLFIRQAKDLGFILQEILELLHLRVSSKKTCGDVKRIAKVKIKEIERKIKNLRQIKQALLKLSAQCKGSGPITECPILENFSSIKRIK